MGNPNGLLCVGVKGRGIGDIDERAGVLERDDPASGSGEGLAISRGGVTTGTLGGDLAAGGGTSETFTALRLNALSIVSRAVVEK